jgi:hypothetical protein
VQQLGESIEEAKDMVAEDASTMVTTGVWGRKDVKGYLNCSEKSKEIYQKL